MWASPYGAGLASGLKPVAKHPARKATARAEILSRPAHARVTPRLEICRAIHIQAVKKLRRAHAGEEKKAEFLPPLHCDSGLELTDFDGFRRDEAQLGFRREGDVLLAGCGCTDCARAGARRGADQCAFAAAGDAADDGAER